MTDPDNLVLTLLREIRAEMNTRFSDLGSKLNQFDERFDRLEKKVENVRQAMHGESLLARYAVAEVDERFEEIEKRSAALENRN